MAHRNLQRQSSSYTQKPNRNNNKNANVDMESLDAQNKQRNLQHKEQNWRHCNI